MSDSPSKGERTSRAIIEAAHSLFIENGYHATSMRQIAQRADLALGGIYNHFDSKEQIFETVLLEKHPYRQILQVLLAVPGDSIEQFARNAAHTILDELGKRPDFLKLALVELSEFKGKHITILFQIIFPEILPLFQRFKEREGDLRELPLEVMFLSLVGTFFSYFIIKSIVAPTSVFGLEDVSLELYIEIFLHGVLNPSKHRPQFQSNFPETVRLERQ